MRAMPVLFGYEIDSDLPLARCRPAPAPRGRIVVRCTDRDLLSREGELVAWDDEPGAQYALATSGSVVLIWCSLTGAYAIDGAAGRVEVQPRGEPDHWEHRLSATVLPLLLAERGDLALHASSVAVDGGAIVFCGRRGAGKSTLAAALAVRGHQVLSEDGVVISQPGPGALAWPGPDGVRISQGTLDTLNARLRSDAPENGRLGASVLETVRLPEPGLDHTRQNAATDRNSWSKETLLLSGAAAAPHPIRAVVLLGPRAGRQPSIRGLDPVAALPALIPHVLFRGREGLERAMASAAQLITHVPIFEASLPEDLAHAVDHASTLLEAALVLGGSCLSGSHTLTMDPEPAPPGRSLSRAHRDDR